MNREERDPDDAGFSLLELLVAMGIFGLLMTLVVSMFVTGSQSFSTQRAEVQNSRTASTTMNELTRIIRSGTELPVYGSATASPVFSYAGSESLIMTSLIDTGTAATSPPIRVQFSRNSNNQLVESRWTAYSTRPTYWLFPADASSSRLLVASLVPASAATPLFTYYDKTGNALTPAAGGSLTSAQIRNIASVKVTLRVQAAPGAANGVVELRNEVGLPNLGVSRVEVNG